MANPILIAQHGNTECFLRPDKGDLEQPKMVFFFDEAH